MEEVTTSPFVERLLKKGYEVLYLTEAVDESAISEFEGKKFQNVAKEGFSIDGDTKAAKERKEALKEQFEPQTHSKTQDMQRDYYLNQKKALEINPRHPLIKELLRRVEDNPADASAKDMAIMMFNTATLRSGFALKDTVNFAESIEKMMRETLGVDADEQVDEEEEITDEEPPEDDDDDEEEEDEEEEEMEKDG